MLDRDARPGTGTSVARLITEHGADITLPYLRERLAGDCPRLHSASIYERCGAYFPQPETKDR